jgi:hypothetical protein
MSTQSRDRIFLAPLQRKFEPASIHFLFVGACIDVTGIHPGAQPYFVDFGQHGVASVVALTCIIKVHHGSPQ